MKFLSGLFALALFGVVSVADAGQNLRQKDDGTAAWVREGVDGVEVERPVGAVYLNVLLENISAASTVAVVVPITDSRISLIQSVMLGDITTGDAVLDFWIKNSDGTNASTTEVTNATSRMTLTAVAGVEEGVVDTFTPSSNNTIEQSQSIVIHTKGGSTNDVDAVITITVVPR